MSNEPRLPTPADLALLAQVIQKTDPNWGLWDDSMRLVELMNRWRKWEAGILDYYKTEQKILAAPPPPPATEKAISIDDAKAMLGTKNNDLVRSYFYESMRKARDVPEVLFYEIKTGKKPKRVEHREVSDLYQWAKDNWLKIKAQEKIPESILKIMLKEKKWRDGAANRIKKEKREAKNADVPTSKNPTAGVGDFNRVRNARNIARGKSTKVVI